MNQAESKRVQEEILERADELELLRQRSEIIELERRRYTVQALLKRLMERQREIKASIVIQERRLSELLDDEGAFLVILDMT